MWTSGTLEFGWYEQTSHVFGQVVHHFRSFVKVRVLRCLQAKMSSILRYSAAIARIHSLPTDRGWVFPYSRADVPSPLGSADASSRVVDSHRLLPVYRFQYKSKFALFAMLQTMIQQVPLVGSRPCCGGCIVYRRSVWDSDRWSR
jgi:hypothetical protein